MYLLLIVVTLAIGFGAQAYVNRQIKNILMCLFPTE